MSKSLYWQRIPSETTEYSIDSIRRSLAPRIWDSDGSVGEGYATVGKDLIPYLEGIVEGNGSGDMGRDAQALINAIKKHGQVRIFIHG